MTDTLTLPNLASRFLVFDGPDGSGKSTQLRRFVARAHRSNIPVCEVREPGGTPIGERVRELLLDPAHKEMAVRTELMLYMASRAQLVNERIKPALERGELVIADRYVSSTLAYQGTAGGLSPQEIVQVAEGACGPMWHESAAWPDLTIIFDVDEQTAAARLNPLLDRMEQKGAAFHARVRQGYLDQAAKWPDRYAVIDARANPDQVERQTLTTIHNHFAHATPEPNP